jgi:hypothetical protein
MEAPFPAVSDGKIRKEAYWRGQLEAWKQSGHTVASFCRTNNLNYYKFLWWRKRLSQAPKPHPVSSAFVPVQIKGGQTWACEIETRLGLKIRLANFDVEQIVRCSVALTKEHIACG